MDHVGILLDRLAAVIALSVELGLGPGGRNEILLIQLDEARGGIVKSHPKMLARISPAVH